MPPDSHLPSQKLSLCHILGAFVRNNIIITEAEDLSPMYMVDTPGLFDIPFFVRTNLVYYREGHNKARSASWADRPSEKAKARKSGEGSD